MALREDGPVELFHIDDLRRQKNRLEQRLEDGYVRIDEAVRQGRNVSAWEDFWLSLLFEYESVCDELQDAA